MTDAQMPENANQPIPDHVVEEKGPEGFPIIVEHFDKPEEL